MRVSVGHKNKWRENKMNTVFVCADIYWVKKNTLNTKQVI